MHLDNRKFIFILGMPRSGTTWVAKVLDSYPEILYLHEPDSYIPFKNLPICVNDEFNENDIDIIHNSIKKYFDLSKYTIWSKAPFFPKQYFTNFEYRVNSLALYLIKLVPKFKKLLRLSPLNKVFTYPNITVMIKSVESVGRAKLISKALKNCKIVLILRHPCAHVSSIIEGERNNKFKEKESDNVGIFSELIKSKNAQKYGLSYNDFEKMTKVERLAWRWLLINEHAMNNISNIRNIMLVKYEDICLDPIQEYKRIFDFCEINCGPQTIDFINSSSKHSSRSYYSVYQDTKNMISKWEKKLPKTQKTQIFNVLEKSKILSSFYTLSEEKSII